MLFFDSKKYRKYNTIIQYTRTIIVVVLFRFKNAHRPIYYDFVL